MRTFVKLALGAVMMAGAAAAAAPASAQVSFGIGVGPGYGYYGGPAYGYGRPGYGGACDYRSRWYDPYRCNWNYGYYNGGPVWWGNSWNYGPTRYRYWGGHREYYLGGGWRRDGYRFGGGPRGGYGYGYRGGPGYRR